MECIGPDGHFTGLAVTILAELELGLSCPDELARSSGVPVFRIRSCLHQLAGAGLIEESNDCYHITGRGSALLSNERR